MCERHWPLVLPHLREALIQLLYSPRAPGELEWGGAVLRAVACAAAVEGVEAPGPASTRAEWGAINYLPECAEYSDGWHAVLGGGARTACGRVLVVPVPGVRRAADCAPCRRSLYAAAGGSSAVAARRR